MAYQKGSDFLIKMDTATSGGPTFTTIAAVQTTSLRIGADVVDVTNAGSANKWRELLAGAGIKRVSISGAGVFNDATAENSALTSILNGTIKLWQVIVPTLGTFQGLMQLSQVEYAGRHAGEVQFNIALESAGDITFTAS